MKSLCIYLLVLLSAVSVVSSSLHAQQDTSSYFPLGLWAIWIEKDKPPFSPMYLTQLQWDQERSNWQDINANYMVAWVPVWVEDTVMTQAESIGYKIDLARSTYGFGSQTDTSLRAWIQQATNPPSAVLEIKS